MLGENAPVLGGKAGGVNVVAPSSRSTKLYTRGKSMGESHAPGVSLPWLEERADSPYCARG